MRRPHERILDAMVWLESGRLPMPWHRSLVAYAASFRPRAGSFKREAAVLVDQHLITTSEAGLVLEHDGRQAAEAPGLRHGGSDDVFTRTEYWRRMDRKLGVIECRVARVLRSAPDGLDRAALHERVGTSRAELRHTLAALVKAGTIDSGRHHGVDIYRRTGVLYPLNVFERRELEGPPPSAMDYVWKIARGGRVQHALLRGEGSGLCNADPDAWSTRPTSAAHCRTCEALLAMIAAAHATKADQEPPS